MISIYDLEKGKPVYYTVKYPSTPIECIPLYFGGVITNGVIFRTEDKQKEYEFRISRDEDKKLETNEEGGFFLFVNEVDALNACIDMNEQLKDHLLEHVDLINKQIEQQEKDCKRLTNVGKLIKKI